MIYQSCEHQLNTWHLAMITLNPPPPEPEHVLCKHCGTPILIEEGKKRKEFCNAYCNKAYAYRQAIANGWKRYRAVEIENKQERQCPSCGKMFMPFNRNYSRQKYCSYNCKKEADNANERAKRKAKKDAKLS